MLEQSNAKHSGTNLKSHSFCLISKGLNRSIPSALLSALSWAGSVPWLQVFLQISYDSGISNILGLFNVTQRFHFHSFIKLLHKTSIQGLSCYMPGLGASLEPKKGGPFYSWILHDSKNQHRVDAHIAQLPSWDGPWPL